ncbi:MAG: HAD-IA family hydrolase [Rubrivivax sp.]|nr:HAD-IA family hydrolase [Rubrivivax sp.]
MPHLHASFGQYIQQHLQLTEAQSDALRRRYWLRYGATLLGLVRHHGVEPAHFLHHTHLLPGLEQRVRGHRADLAALARLPGRKVILTNAPAAYAARVLGVLGIGHLFERVLSIEDMHMFGQLRPKPDARMLRWVAARLGVAPAQCVLVEDTLAHQKSARRIGMGTVWMQRWLRPAPAAAQPQPPLPTTGPRPATALRRPARRVLAGKPAYVDRRVRRLGQLLRR